MSDVIPLFHALSDPTRFAIVNRLSAEGEVGAGALSEGFSSSASAVSQHLKVLREAGLIKKRSVGQARIYSLNKQAVGRIKSWALEHEAFWNGSLDRLEAALDEEFGETP